MALRRAARRISQRYDETLAPAGLRATQFAILAVLREGRGLSVNELAERLDLDRTTTGKNLRPLQRDGLVSVAASPDDRRSRAIGLTDEGMARLARAAPLWASAQEGFEAANGRTRARGLRDELRDLR